MSKTSLVASHINADLEVMAPEQTLLFNDPLVKLKLNNRFLATSSLSTILDLDFGNANLAGYKFRQVTGYNTTDGGSFSLNYFEQDGRVVSRLFNATQSEIVFDVTPKYANSPLVNKDYVDSTRGLTTVTLIGDISGISNNAGNITTTFNKSINVDSGTLGSLPITRLSNYPLDGTKFAAGDGTWKIPPATTITAGNNINVSVSDINYTISLSSVPVIDINTNTSGSLTINRLANYPSDTTKFLNGNGGWTAPAISSVVAGSNITVTLNGTTYTVSLASLPIIDINSGTTGSLAINRLTSPADGTKFLSGDNTWKTITYPTQTVTLIGDITGTGQAGTNITTTLKDQGLTAGTYYYPTNITMTKTGLITAMQGGSQPLIGVVAGTGLSASNVNGIANVSINNTGVNAGTYTYATIKTNAQGQILIANSGVQPITSIIAGTNTTVSQNGGNATINATIPTININSGTSGQLPISRLQNFPNQPNLVLDGEGDWSPMGLQIQTVSGVLTSAQILNMRLSNSPVQVLPAPPTNFGIAILQFFVHYLYAGIPYNNGGGIGLFTTLNPGIAITEFVDQNLLHQSTNCVAVVNGCYQQGTAFATTAGVINRPVYISHGSSPYTDGNGLLVYFINYFTWQLA